MMSFEREANSAASRASPPKYGSVEEGVNYERLDTGVNEAVLAFSDKSIRNGFIRKVFSLLTLQLLIVISIVALALFNEDIRFYVQTHPWLYWLSYIAFLLTYILLMCCEGPRRCFPLNIILLTLLTVSIAYMTAMISSMHNTQVVFWALGICSVCCLALIIFASQSRYDFTSWMPLLLIAGMCVILFGLLTLTLSLITDMNIAVPIYSGLMALVFMAYVAIDVQLIVGGKRLEINPEEYIFAAVFIFLDIIFIFWFLLEIFGFARN